MPCALRWEFVRICRLSFFSRSAAPFPGGHVCPGGRLLVTALVATLTAGLVVTPAAATPEQNPGTRHSHVGEWVLKPSFDQYTTDYGATWADQEPDGFDINTLEYSSDSGATWTATSSDYLTGEAGTDSNDGANAGQFRYRSPHRVRVIAEGDPRWSIDAGTTWTDQGADGAGIIGFDLAAVEYSSDSGATWGSATESTYTAGEAGTDGGDGPDAGQFRRRRPHQRQRTWVCFGEESVFTEIGAALTAPTSRCAVVHSSPYNTSVDDGVEPPGDWCVSGVSAIICRGEGYAYREARRELGF